MEQELIRSVPATQFAAPRRAALSLLAEANIKNPPVNPARIANAKGVQVKFVVFSEAEYAANISGFFYPKEMAIYVNEAQHPYWQTYAIAHELGHYILHEEWTRSEAYRMLLRSKNEGVPDNMREEEANLFAEHLLVPRFMLDKYYDVPPPTLSAMFAVSVEVINKRLRTEYGVRT